MQMFTKEGRARNRPMLKQSRAAVQSALDAHDRTHAISSEIRARHGLAPLADGLTVKQWRTKVAGTKAAAPSLPTLDELVKRREKIKRDEAKLDVELRELIASRTVPARRIAEALGVSRQRVYQLAG